MSPSDGRFQCAGRVEKGCRILVKDKPYDVARLIGSEDEATGFLGGQFAVIYLSPRDYHRVHAPIDGTITEVRSVGGDLYPVNAIGERWVRDLFVANKRVAIAIDSPTYGRITLVMVGAMIVGRITVDGIDAADVPVGIHKMHRQVRRGDEIGAFHLGSTVVVFAEPKAPTWQRQAGPIRLGDSLVRSG
jgi:phosphatidylserine decarboxylase